MKLAVRDENLLVGRLEKYNRRKSPRAAIGKEWSQHDLATKVQLLGCECSDLTILRIEKGDRFVPDYEVKALAKVFNVSYESLLDD